MITRYVCVCVHAFLITAVYLYFQSVADVNTDQLDELIKVIMIVSTCTLNNVQYSITCSLAWCIVEGDPNLKGEARLHLYG